VGSSSHKARNNNGNDLASNPDEIMPFTGVSTLFETLVANTQLTQAQLDDASGKHARVRAVLNKAYYGIDSGTANSFLVGSYGKKTAIRPPSDVDILFSLPWSVFSRFKERTGNIQSQLLQEVKGILQKSFPTTAMKADGQIVLVPFTTYAIEVLPAFEFTIYSSGFYHADSNGGGSWRSTDPKAEMQVLVESNRISGSKTTHLIKLMKAWKIVCGVKIKSLGLELLAIRFMSGWQYKKEGYLYYDFMVRDFLGFILNNVNAWIPISGTSETISLGSEWEAQARIALNAAIRATVHGAEDRPYSAKDEWRNIFGNYIT
jgi:hypothetical protein